MDHSSEKAHANSIMVPLANLRTDEARRARVKLRADVVRQYAAAMAEQLADGGGLRFPPVILFHDGQESWLADGIHRVLAAGKAGLTELLAEVRQGTKRDAWLYALGSNSAHGLPRTAADKRHVVAELLADAEWAQWNDREIARRCQVSRNVVRRMRKKAHAANKETPENASQSRDDVGHRKVHRNGTTYEMRLAGPTDAGATLAPLPTSPQSHAQEPAPAKPAALTDALGIPLRELTARVFMASDDFQEAEDLFARLACVLDRIAQSPAGELYRQEMVRTMEAGKPGFSCPHLRVSRSRLTSAIPYSGYCPNCHPTHPTRPYPGCKTCGGRGWTTRRAFEACPQHEREQILRLRPPIGPPAR